MFRGNICVLRDKQIRVERHELVLYGEDFVLDTRNGEIKDQTRILPLTGVPIMITKSTTCGFIDVHYKDHIDLFDARGGCFCEIVANDPTYIRAADVTIGWDTCHRVGDDLVVDFEDHVKPGFFKNCQKFLYISNPCYLDGDPDQVAHYVDLNGVIHGRDPIFTTRQDKFGRSFTILCDDFLCVFDDQDYVFINRNVHNYDEVCALDIHSIEIHPNVCRITTETATYKLDEDGLTEIDPGMTIYPSYPPAKWH